jgi:hypothetical protein
MARRGAIRPEMCNRLVITHVRVCDPAIAILPRIRLRGRRSGKREKTPERDSSESDLAQNRTEPQSWNFHKILQERARAGLGIVLKNQTPAWCEGCATEQPPKGRKGCNAEAALHPQGVFGQVRTERLVVVIVVVPITIGVPFVCVFIPPPFAMLPAVGARGR